MPRAFSETEQGTIRSALLRAGRRAAARGGFRRCSVAKLARAAGISKGAFYRFFEGKEALYVALLEQAEAEVRGELTAAARGPEGLARAVRGLFTVLRNHPILGALADPDEFAWLMRVLPPELLAANRVDDDRYFGELLADLERRGLARDDVDPRTFAGLAPAALALALQRPLIGADRYDAVVDLIVDGIVARLTPDRRVAPRHPGTR